MAWEAAYAADHIDLLLRLKEVVIGQPLVTMPVRSGVGDGIVYGIHTTVSATPIESWAVTCTNDALPATFSVVGSVSGAQANATVGTPYSNSKLSFQITAGSVPFAAGDNFVFSTQTNPLVAATQTWTVNRWLGTGAKVVNYLSSSTFNGSGSFNADKAFDEDLTTAWTSDNALGINSWIQVQFDKPIDIRKYSIGGFNGDEEAAPTSFNAAYSDDGTSWTIDSTVTGQTLWQYHEVRNFFLTGAAGAHKYWRINILSVKTGTTAKIPSLALYDTNGTFNVGRYGDGYDAIFKGPGTAGGDNIYVSLRPDAYVLHGPNWMVAGSVGYSSGLGTFEQPKNSSEGFDDVSRLALYDQPMKYWIIASGRRIMVFTRFQNITEGCHLGFPLPYALPSQYPYPLLIAGSQSSHDSQYGWTRTDGGHRLFMHPGTHMYNMFGGIDGASTPCRLYTPGNIWKQASNRVEDDGWSNGGTSLIVWPYQSDEGGSTGGDPLVQQLDGKWPMTPIVYLDRQAQAAYAELDGVKHIPGIHAIESLITYEGDTWVILNNVFREADNEFFAVRLS